MTTKLDFNEVYQFMKEFGIDVLNRYDELIIDLPSNTYTSIRESEDIEDVKMRVVFNLCRPIGKGLEKRRAEGLLARLNEYFNTELSREDLHLMYSELCYRSKYEDFKDFIKRGFPMEELRQRDN